MNIENKGALLPLPILAHCGDVFEEIAGCAWLTLKYTEARQLAFNGRQIYQQRRISRGAAILNRSDAADACIFDAETDVICESDTERAAGAERRGASSAESESEEASTSAENCKQAPGGAYTNEDDWVASQGVCDLRAARD